MFPQSTLQKEEGESLTVRRLGFSQSAFQNEESGMGKCLKYKGFCNLESALRNTEREGKIIKH